MCAHTRTQITYCRALCGRMYNVRLLTIQLYVWLNALCERERVCVWRERELKMYFFVCVCVERAGQEKFTFMNGQIVCVCV